MELSQLIEIINDYDPINLIALGAPEDEYAGEARDILEKLNKGISEKETESLVKATFIHMFDEDIVGKYDFAPMSREIWNSFRNHRAQT